MRATVSLLLALGLLLATSPAAQAQASGETTQITAQVVDLSCLMVHDLQGENHRECAQVCSDQGVPLALLGEDGQLYHVVSMAMPSSGDEENQRLRPHAERMVTVEGTVVDRGGSQGIIIESLRAQ